MGLSGKLETDTPGTVLAARPVFGTDLEHSVPAVLELASSARAVTAPGLSSLSVKWGDTLVECGKADMTHSSPEHPDTLQECSLQSLPCPTPPCSHGESLTEAEEPHRNRGSTGSSSCYLALGLTCHTWVHPCTHFLHIPARLTSIHSGTSLPFASPLAP